MLSVRQKMPVFVLYNPQITISLTSLFSANFIRNRVKNHPKPCICPLSLIIFYKMQEEHQSNVGIKEFPLLLVLCTSDLNWTGGGGGIGWVIFLLGKYRDIHNRHILNRLV